MTKSALICMKYNRSNKQTQMPHPKYTSTGISARPRVTQAVNWPKQARLSWQTAPRVV